MYNKSAKFDYVELVWFWGSGGNYFHFLNLFLFSEAVESWLKVYIFVFLKLCRGKTIESCIPKYAVDKYPIHRLIDKSNFATVMCSTLSLSICFVFYKIKKISYHTFQNNFLYIVCMYVCHHFYTMCVCPSIHSPRFLPSPN